MKLQTILLCGGFITCSFTAPPSTASTADPQSEEQIQNLKKTLAVEQEKTKEAEQAVAQKNEQAKLQTQIEEEKKKQQDLAAQPAAEEPKKHGVEKRADKVKKWAEKHGF